MLSATFGCVTYLRGIFPDDSFLEQRFNPGVGNLKTQKKSPDLGQRLMLIRRNYSPQATELLDYLVSFVSIFVLNLDKQGKWRI